MRKSSFKNRIIELWNKLPNKMMNMKNLITFEMQLDKFWAWYALKYYTKARLLAMYANINDMKTDLDIEVQNTCVPKSFCRVPVSLIPFPSSMQSSERCQCEVLKDMLCFKEGKWKRVQACKPTWNCHFLKGSQAPTESPLNQNDIEIYW